MEKISQIKCQAIEYIDQYFAGLMSAHDLRTWAMVHPVFANPKELDNSDDWIMSNALALMCVLADKTAERPTVEKGLREARQFLTGEVPFPDDHWPAGLLQQKK
jgi:hypothetical protein